jgi:hypothetical protein
MYVLHMKCFSLMCNWKNTEFGLYAIHHIVHTNTIQHYRFVRSGTGVSLTGR